MYERLTPLEKMKLLKVLSEKTILSENYEEMVLNLVRSAYGQNNVDEARYIYQYLISPHVFTRFTGGMDDFNGKANYTAFVEELTKLFAIAYPERLKASEGKIKEWKGLYVSSDLYYDWSHSFGRDIQLRNGKYSIPFGHVIVDLLPSQVVNVYFGRDFDFFPPGGKRMVAMPAFALAYLLKHEQDKLLYGTAEFIVTTYAMLSGVGEIIAVKNAATAVKVIAWAKLAKEVSFAVLSNDAVNEYIRNRFKQDGEKFIYWFEIISSIDGNFSASNSILFTKDVIDGFNAMMSIWSIIVSNQETSSNLGHENIKSINYLLSEYKKIMSNEEIVF